MTFESPKRLADPGPELKKSEDAIVEIRFGHTFCQGFLLKKRTVVTAPECVFNGQRITMRSIKEPQREVGGRVIHWTMARGTAWVPT